MFKRPDRLYSPVNPTLAKNMRNAKRNSKQRGEDKAKEKNSDKNTSIKLLTKKDQKESSKKNAKSSEKSHAAILEAVYGRKKDFTGFPGFPSSVCFCRRRVISLPRFSVNLRSRGYY